MKKVVTIVLAVLLAITFTGCGKDSMNDQMEAWSRQYFDGLISGDMDSAYEIVQNMISREEFRPIFEHYHAMLEGTDSYELNQLGMNFNRSDGVTTYMVTFLMISDHGEYIIEITDVDNTEMPDDMVFGTREELEPYLKPY